MKEKKPKKRYFTANQIRDEIDRYKTKAQKLMDSAAAYDLKADELYKINSWSEDASFAREQAKKLRRSAERINEKRLPYLSQKLAEFCTEVIPSIIPDGDRSVQA